MRENTDAAQQGLTVLAAFYHLRPQVGGSLQDVNFVRWGVKRHWQPSQIADGIDYAYDQGWVDGKPNNFVELTAQGYAEMLRRFQKPESALS